MIHNIKSKTELSGFYIIFDNTVINETPGHFGISHIVEHMMCKNLDDLIREFDKDGVDWNAFTTTEHIGFFITGLDEYIKKYKIDFLNRILNFELTREQFDIEKKVIINEHISHFGYQVNKHFYNLYRKYFDFYHVIGRKNDIENITYEDCIKYYEEHYLYPSSIYNISKHDKFKYDIKFNKSKKRNLDLVDGVYDNNLDFFYENITNNVSLIYMSNIIREDFAYIIFISAMLSKGKLSPLWKETREKYGDVYQINIGMERFSSDCGVLCLYTQTKEENLERVKESINNVLINKELHMTRERYENIKNNYIISYKKMEENKYINMTNFIINNKWIVKNILKDVTYEKIMEVYDKYFDLNKLYCSVDKYDFTKSNDESS